MCVRVVHGDARQPEGCHHRVMGENEFGALVAPVGVISGACEWSRECTIYGPNLCEGGNVSAGRGWRAAGEPRGLVVCDPTGVWG